MAEAVDRMRSAGTHEGWLEPDLRAAEPRHGRLVWVRCDPEPPWPLELTEDWPVAWKAVIDDGG